MLEGREIPCPWESSYFNQPGRAAQHYKWIWLRLRDRWAEEEHPSLLLCLRSKTARLRVGKSPTPSLFALEALLRPLCKLAWGGQTMGDKRRFSKGCSDRSAVGHSDFPLLGLGNVEKKVTFSTFSFCCSRMRSATSNYRPACQWWPAPVRRAVTPWGRHSALRMRK